MRAVWLALLALVVLLPFAGAERSEAQSSWQCSYYFAQGLQGWVVRHGVYTGADVRSEPPDENVSVDPSVDLWLPNMNTAITSVRVFYESQSPILGWYTQSQLLDGADPFGIATNGPGPVTQEWSGSRVLNNDALTVWIGVPITFLDVGTIRVSRIALEGLGDSPCSRPPVTGSQWRCSYDFASGLGGWTLENGELESGKVVSAAGGQAPGFNAEVTLWLPLAGNVSEFSARYNAVPVVPWWTHNVDLYDGQEARSQVSNIQPGDQTFTASGVAVSNGGLRFTLRLPGVGTGYFALSRIDMRGNGVNPCATTPGGPGPVYEFPIMSLYGPLQDVNTMLLTLPDDLSSNVPEGDWRMLFGYAKFLMSPAAASEFAGPFESVFQHVYFAFYLLLPLALVYFVAWSVEWILRFVIWMFRWLLRLVDLVLQIAQVVGNIIGGLFKFI